MSVNAVINTNPPVEVVTEIAKAAAEVAVDTTISAFDQVKTGAICVAEWLGRQITLIASTLKVVIEKIVEAAKPVFASILEFLGAKAVEFQQLMMANQPVVITALVAVPLTALFVIAGSYLFGSNVAKADQQELVKV